MDDNTQKKIIGENLKFYIELSGKEQREIAMDLDVNYTTFNTWVRGRALPSFSQIRKLAEYFHTTVFHIVDRHDEIDDFQKLTGIYKGLNDEGRKDLLKYANLLYYSKNYLDWIKKFTNKRETNDSPVDYIYLNDVIEFKEDNNNGKS